MKLAIENSCGQWWTGNCWGVKEAREEFKSVDDLPDELPDDNVFESYRNYTLAVYNDDPNDFEVCYEEDDDNDDDFVSTSARAKIVG